MKAKIQDYRGYECFYDTERKEFFAVSGETRAASAPTQDALEAKLRRLESKAFQRVPVLMVTGHAYGSKQIEYGEVTSLNLEDGEVWAVINGQRGKYGLGYGQLYEKTDANIAIAQQIIEKHQEIRRIDKEIKELKDSMGGLINRAYFEAKKHQPQEEEHAAD